VVKKELVEEKRSSYSNMRGIMTARTKPLTVVEPIDAAVNTKAVNLKNQHQNQL
jgi:electron transfer flavoprotein beta subunit